ncbi:MULTISPECIES: undecaprenyl-diphosphate phosphatase [Holdemanella]|uniref:undecaprenyl-diphosphate phosphatase n=1 Tax=Holdemanella TaxID=1573535 RepID=UPI002108B421|nr:MULTISPECIES: undecaprenyl-diphosphate phosphatase [Holdemanella]MCQ4803094.1 undecaprenyl-diphosphate phosphatase [Holdemanella sp. MSK.7.32]
MIEILKSILYGIVEGITEWLPISSTGHMILLEEIMPMNVSKSFWSMFLVVIQLGAILAVVVLYWNKIFPFRKNKEGKYTSVKSIWILWSKILVATIPAAIIGLALDDWIDAHLYNGFVVAIMLILVGVAFIYIENRNKDMRPSVNSLSALSYKDALIIGLFQVVAAVLPGTSRSGATIVGGLMIGVSRAVAAEFTFFLAIPVMFGASLLKLVKFGLAFSVLEFFILVIGMVVAFFVSIFVIRFLMSYIKKHDFKVFGWYRIVLGAFVLIFFAIRALL